MVGAGDLEKSASPFPENEGDLPQRTAILSKLCPALLPSSAIDPLTVDI